MTVVAWTLLGSAGLLLVQSVVLILLVRSSRELRARIAIGEVEKGRLNAEIKGLNESIDLLTGPDPTLDELRDEAAAAVAAAGGLSEAESRAADRLVGSGPTGGAAAGNG